LTYCICSPLHAGHGGGHMGRGDLVSLFKLGIRRDNSRVSAFSLLLAAVCMYIAPLTAMASEHSLEKELQTELGRSRVILETLQAKLRAGSSVSPEISQLRSLADGIRISHLLLEERFKLREEKAKTLGATAFNRHKSMVGGYRAALTEYLSLIDAIPPNDIVSQTKIRNLQSLLERILPKRKRPLIGSLPYKHLNYPAQEPNSNTPITPAYKGGNRTVSPDDTAVTPEAPLSNEIATLAQSLNWNPVSIYEYVKNNVETEWYWGCMKGAEETLHQKSGNDCDQAALLTALLRTSGFPTRYVRGTIQFFPNIDQVKNLTGFDDPSKIAEFFQKAGIPYTPVIKGGTIDNFQIEHIWIESQIPYANYRGAIIDEHGKTWLGLDTSIKVKGYTYNNAPDILSTMSLSTIRNEYLGLATAATPSTPYELNQTPLEYLRYFVNTQLAASQPTPTYSDYLGTRTLVPEVLNILPSSTQFILIKATNEYTSLPEELIQKVRFLATRNSQPGTPLFDITLPLYKLSNQQIAMSYEPETVQDQETIDSYGGLDNTPAYLVHLRPVLKINNERVIVAQDGLPMGADYGLSIDLISPNGTQSILNTHIVGNLSILGITAQRALLPPSPLAGEGGGEGAKDATRLLYEEAINYNNRWNQAENELASLFHLAVTRPLPTVDTLGGIIDVTYLLDMPHGFTWKGVFVDADLRTIEAVQSSGFGVQDEKTKLFMQLSSLQGSILENRIFEDDFKVESISTAKLFQIVNAQPATGILTIDRTNVDAVLPTLDFDDNIKEDIANSVNQDYVIRVPQSEITYHDWTGVGYLKESPATGESGWMLSGMIAGGCTVDEAWLNNLYGQQTLSTPYSGAVNHDSLAGVRMFKIPATDKQDPKTVGTALSTPFAIAVLDGKDTPVVGATVSFRIIAGGGTIQCLNSAGTPTGQPSETSCDAPTSNTGIAKATLTLGVRTDANADYMKLDADDENYTQIGLNLVTASAASHSGVLVLNAPFEAYGKPDVPVAIEKIYPLNPVVVMVNNPGGTLQTKITDTHGNPVSNVPLTFTAAPAESRNTATDPLPDVYRNLELYSAETCTSPYPLYGDCISQRSLSLKTHYYGAQVNTILGNTLNTHYLVVAISPGLPVVTFDLYSDGSRSSAWEYVPSVLMTWNLGIVNVKGDAVNAAKAGTELKAPLAAKMFLLQDDYDIRSEECTKPDSSGNTVTFTGYSFVSRGTMTARPVTNGSVAFTVKQGNGTAAQTQNAGNGLYQAAYRTGAQPMKNIIEANGSATVSVPQIYGVDRPGGYIALTKCLESPDIPPMAVTLQHGEFAVLDRTTNELAHIFTSDQKPTYTAYGVNTQLSVEPTIILLDDRGFTTVDTRLTYTILPSDYNAIRADLDSYKTDQNNTETWEGYVVADKTQGQGQVVFVAGTPFDIAKLYKEEVVLNRGTDMEMRGEKKSIPLAQLVVLTDVYPGKTVDEIKFGTGADLYESQKKKIYRLNIQSAALLHNCESLTGKISIINPIGQLITLPSADGQAYAAEYQLRGDSTLDGCMLQIIDTIAHSTQNKFIVSNRSRAALNEGWLNYNVSDKAVLYGGIGNQVKIELNHSQMYIPIEPVGVIVLGIDGLRQDVLYSVDEQHVNELHVDYYVQPSELKGLCDVLGGKLGSSCDTTGWENKHIKLKDVTAVFPSITLASWASIFTGKMPNETGITGNEFFARDLYTKGQGVPSRRDGSLMPIMNPAGIVSFDSGAFNGYDIVGPGSIDFFVPRQLLWKPSANAALTPQNDTRVMTAQKTLFESISEMEGVQKYLRGKDADAVTVAYSHYARGASNWLTFNLLDPTSLSWPVASMMDKASWNRFEEWLKGKFLTNGVRNTVSFSPLTVWYLPGLDHNAHKAGMDTYKSYFIDKTDDYIWNLTKWLKNYDEFDNKIFVIVADHGHTAMPTNLTYKSKWLGMDVDKPAEMSCGRKTDFGDADNPNTRAQNAELNNNNLHIWELGELFKAVGKFTGGSFSYRVLAPESIADLFSDEEYGARSSLSDANVIAALNGPMAHIYVTDADDLGEVAEILKLTIQGENAEEAVNKLGLAEKSYKDLRSTIGRLKNSIDKILVRVNGNYCVFDGLNEDGSANCAINGTLTSLAYVDPWTRINGLNNVNRSGDIILIMRDATLDNVTDRYTTGVACKSWHGSLSPSDSYVPFIFAYPGGNNAELKTMLRKDAVCGPDYDNCKANWKLPDIIKEIISEQYK
jgi:type I phosphodiesterase/nucleotide pyrophosphatase/transglutaminase superfamily protein